MSITLISLPKLSWQRFALLGVIFLFVFVSSSVWAISQNDGAFIDVPQNETSPKTTQTTEEGEVVETTTTEEGEVVETTTTEEEEVIGTTTETTTTETTTPIPDDGSKESNQGNGFDFLGGFALIGTVQLVSGLFSIGSFLISILIFIMEFFRSEPMDQKETLEEVYRPLYNEVANILGKKPPLKDGEYKSIWDQTEPYLKLKHPDDPLEAKLEEYANRINSLNRRNNRKTAEVLAESNVPFVVSKEGKKVLKVGQNSIPVEDWLDCFHHVILTSENSSELRTEMLKCSPLGEIEAKPDEIIEYWDQEYPGWEEPLWTALNKCPEIQEQRSSWKKIQKDAEWLHQRIENRLQDGWDIPFL